MTMDQDNNNFQLDGKQQEVVVEEGAVVDAAEVPANNDKIRTSTTPATSNNKTTNNNKNEVSNLNAYYGNTKGFLATVSLILNAGLMVYAHVGLSAVVLSSQPPIRTNGSSSAATSPPSLQPPGGNTLCNSNDLMIWEDRGGKETRPVDSNFCSRRYNDVGCLLESVCIEECFNTTYGYSESCSTCFGVIPQCSFDTGCAYICAADSFSAECQECNIPCIENLDECLGFPLPNNNVTNVTTTDTRRILQEGGEGECVDLDVDELNWYVVYELTFINSIQKAWFGNAKFLAIIVVVFSGIWPYAKNIVLVWIWYYPMSVESRTSYLTWLLRLSKYTLVDVFAVVAILVGVLLQLDVGGTEVATRAEPRPSIIAFFLATLWEFCQIEWVVHCHNRYVQNDEDESEDGKKEVPSASAEETGPADQTNDNKLPGHLLDAMRFRTKMSSNDDTLGLANATGTRLWVAFLLIVSLALYLAGSLSELVQFSSFGAGDTVGCKNSYNLVTLGNAMVSELGMTANSAAAGTWTLYIAYVILVLFLPITVHCMQLLLLALASFGDNKETNRRVCRWTASLWGFSSVEVLLIGVFSVENKFSKFVSAFAGKDNAQFFSITSTLGPGFYILIAYSIISGLLQYFIYCATAEYYRIDPYHKVHLMWTKMFGCWLEKSR